MSEADTGVYDAMNKGLKIATGEYVGFLNGDDSFASPESVHLLADGFASTGADIAYADVQYVRNSPAEDVIRHWRSGDFSPRKKFWGWMPPHPTFYVRRNLIERLGGFDTTYRIAADYDLMLRYLNHPGLLVVYIPAVLVNMRVGGISNSGVRNLMDKSAEDLRVIRSHKLGSFGTLAAKIFRKAPQFLGPPAKITGRAAARTFSIKGAPSPIAQCRYTR